MPDADPPGRAPPRPPPCLELMTDQRPNRAPAPPPTVSPPPAFVERRVTFRRKVDRLAHEEKVLLARALDILASDAAAEERLAGLLRLLARTVGARRAAVVADGIERRAAVSVDPRRGSGNGRCARRVAGRQRATQPGPSRCHRTGADLADRRRRPGRSRGRRRRRCRRRGERRPMRRTPATRRTTRSSRSPAPARSPSASSSAGRPTPSGSPTACRRPSPATPPSPCRSSRASSPPSASSLPCALARPSGRRSSRRSPTSSGRR